MEFGTIKSDGSDAPAEHTLRTAFVSVEPSTLYTLATKEPGEPFVVGKIVEYDADKKLVRYCALSSTIGPRSFTTSSETHYIRWFTSSHEQYVTLEYAGDAYYCLEKGAESSVWRDYTSDLIHDIPENEGMKNFLDRLSIFCDSLLYCKGDGMGIGYPNVTKLGTADPYDSVRLKQGSLIYGFPYSSVRKTNTYVGLEVSLDSYFSALDNPASILYTDNYRDKDNPGYSSAIFYAFSPYGAVCSSILDYAYNLDFIYSTYEWNNIEGMRKIDPIKDGIKLGDSLCNVKEGQYSGGHLAVITDILRNSSGKIAYVEITEAAVPTMVRTYVTGAYFLNAHVESYNVYRYDNLKFVPPCESDLATGKAHPESALAADRGDKAVYTLGSTVKINIIDTSASSLLIEYKDGSREIKLSDIGYENINGKEYKIYRFTPEKCGRYYARLIYPDGSVSGLIYFICASSGEIALSTNSAAAGDTITVEFNSNEFCEPIGVCIETTSYVTRMHRELTAEEIESGKVSFSYPVSGSYVVRIIYENEYGRISSEKVRLKLS